MGSPPVLPMTSIDNLAGPFYDGRMALKEKKRAAETKVDPSLAAEIRKRRGGDGTLSCAEAVAIAREKGVETLEVGAAADAIGVRLSLCQLGLFGYPGHLKGWAAEVGDEPIPENFEASFRSAGAPSGSIACAAVWGQADRFGVPRLEAGRMCDRLGLKIVRCQLGAF